MGTEWLDPSFESPFEAAKDDALKDQLACAGQWVTFKFQDVSKDDEQLFAYFEREFEEITIDGDVPISTSDPIVECRYADFNNVPKQGDYVDVVQTFDNVQLNLNFEIRDRKEADEQGAMMFTLKLIGGSRVVN